MNNLELFLRIEDLCKLLKISKPTLVRLRSTPETALHIDLKTSDGSIVKFPSPDVLIGSIPLWDKEKMINWLKALSEPIKADT